MDNVKFADKTYYENIKQSEDRVALIFFSNIVKKYFHKGTILDYGCGTGHFLKKFTENRYIKLGYDVSDYAVSCAKKINPDTLFINNPEMDLEDNSIDCICSLHVLEHIEDPACIVNLFNRKLKPGGLLFVIVPNDKSLGKKIKKNNWFAFGDKTHVSLLRVDQWIEIMKKNNFDIVKVATDGLWDVPYFKYFPIILQKLLFYPTAAIQIWSKKLFLPLPLGENLILIVMKQG